MASPNQLSPYITLVHALLFFCLYFYLSFLWKKRHLFIKSWNVPGPFNLPVIGAGYLVLTRPEYVMEKIVTLQKKYPEGGKFWFGNRLFYFLFKPDHIEKVLGSNKLVQKDFFYNYITDCIGEGLLTAPPQKWKKHRRNIIHSFNQNVLDSYVDVFAEKGLVLTEVLAENVGKKIDLDKILSRCTLDITCETAMGLQLNIQKINGDFVRAFEELTSLVFVKIFYFWNHFDIIWRFLGHDKTLKAIRKKINNITDLVIKQKLETLEAKKHRNSSLAGIKEVPLRRLAFLDHIMESGQLDAKELRDEVNMFLIAGTDTSSRALTFIFAILGMFPHIQQKVLQEVLDIMGNDRKPEFKDLPHMVYTERVIKETLRLFPVACFFGRTITEDVDVGDFVIPKGVSATFGSVFIHRNPKYWPDPLKFDPERFLPEEVAKRHTCAYIPFSFGPRNCIGFKNAMMTMKVIIATVIRKFNIHCEYKKIEDIKLKADLLLLFQDGAKVTVTRREQ